MAAVVGVSRIDTGRVLTRPVDRGNVLGEVPGARPVEVSSQVGVSGIDSRVDDANVDPTAGGSLMSLVDVHHRHIPLQAGQRFGALLDLFTA